MLGNSQAVTTFGTTTEMFGFGHNSGWLLTPAGSAVVQAAVSGFGFASAAADGGAVAIVYGTGTAPIQGGGFTGVTMTVNQNFGQGGGTPDPYFPIALTGLVSGLIKGTQYWFDIACKSSPGGSFSVQAVNWSAYEIGGGAVGAAGPTGPLALLVQAQLAIPEQQAR